MHNSSWVLRKIVGLVEEAKWAPEHRGYFKLLLALDQRRPPGRSDCFFALNFLGLTWNGELLCLPGWEIGSPLLWCFSTQMLDLEGELGTSWMPPLRGVLGRAPDSHMLWPVLFIPFSYDQHPARLTSRNFSPLSLSSFFGSVKQVALRFFVQMLGTEGTWVLVFSGEGECWIHGLWWPEHEALSIL